MMDSHGSYDGKNVIDFTGKDIGIIDELGNEHHMSSIEDKKQYKISDHEEIK